MRDLTAMVCQHDRGRGVEECRGMRSSCVKSLVFSAGPEADGVVYRDPPIVKWETSRGRYRLEDGQLTVEPMERHATAVEARAAVQPDLDAWEAFADLGSGIGELRFHLRSVSIESGTENSEVCGDIGGAADFLVGEKTKPAYPSPPTDFNADSEIVRSLMARYREWKAGRQTLEGVAYFSYRLLRRDFDSESGAAGQWRISANVMGTLNTLSSRRGGSMTARKPDAEPFGAGELAWLERALPAIILQVAAVEAGAEPEVLTKAALPTIG